MRIQSYTVREVAIFVLNVLAFILAGLHLRPILAHLGGADWRAILIVCIVVRIEITCMIHRSHCVPHKPVIAGEIQIVNKLLGLPMTESDTMAANQAPGLVTEVRTLEGNIEKY